MKEKEGRRIVAMEAFHVAKKSNQELKRDIKSVEVALDSAKRQAKGQQVLLYQAEDQLATSKEQTITLKKKLEEVEKAKDQAE